MLTIGVDIAKDPSTTAVCTVRWQDGSATVESLVIGADDAVVLAALAAPHVAVVALDAPFGWPAAMVSAVSTWHPGGRWAGPTDVAFRLRRTDVVTAARTKETVLKRRAAGEAGLRPAVPLSVSADKIAMAAWRCCALLNALVNNGAEVITDRMGTPLPLDGRCRVVEAYPAATLAIWGVPREGYKRKDAAALGVRGAILAVVERAGAARWIRWAPGVREQCAATEHALDALICALVARTAMLGLVGSVTPEDVAVACAEGWIALPHRDGLWSLAALVTAP